jgi:hypothetical protein
MNERIAPPPPASKSRFFVSPGGKLCALWKKCETFHILSVKRFTFPQNPVFVEENTPLRKGKWPLSQVRAPHWSHINPRLVESVLGLVDSTFGSKLPLRNRRARLPGRERRLPAIFDHFHTLHSQGHDRHYSPGQHIFAVWWLRLIFAIRRDVAFASSTLAPITFGLHGSPYSRDRGLL